MYAIAHRETSDWRCHNPKINRDRPSYLAGNTQAAIRCVTERMNIVGLCGKAARLFVARERNSAAPGIDALDV